ncbi:MAG: CRISPR-associated endonuclease Cas1 [Bacteroidia bacterium]|nr:CRISPR-associated endonuclease Cas1 [Bacteroidia bacterium]
MQLILDTKGLKLLKKRNSFLIEPEEGASRTISPKKLSSIAITQSVMISSEAVVLAIKNEVPILFFDRIGKAQARLWSPYFGSIATLRRMQVKFGESPRATEWMIKLFQLKTEGQLSNLKYLASQLSSRNANLDKAIVSIQRQFKGMSQFEGMLLGEVQKKMMGIEGNIARTYWRAFGTAIPVEYRFEKRSRKPAADEFNAVLNYMYGMLYSVVEGALFSAGLDPHLGLLHSDEYNKPVLAFDLIEAFRPWVDHLLLGECLVHTLEKSFFTKNQFGLFLNKSGKAHIIPLFNDFLRTERSWLTNNSSVKNHIYYLASRLAQRIRTFEMDEDFDSGFED